MGRKAQGLWAWALQRITAVYLGIFTLYLLAMFIFSPPTGLVDWQQWAGSPLNSLGIMLFFLATLFHSWIGIRDFLIDYIPMLGIRVTMLSLFAFGLLAIGLWVLKIMIMVML